MSTHPDCKISPSIKEYCVRHTLLYSRPIWMSLGKPALGNLLFQEGWTHDLLRSLPSTILWFCDTHQSPIFLIPGHFIIEANQVCQELFTLVYQHGYLCWLVLVTFFSLICPEMRPKKAHTTILPGTEIRLTSL